ncbi:MAG: hypothetical protein MJ252_03585, partial [archaeon]|nr:hypothetical protein [archaeon]
KWYKDLTRVCEGIPIVLGKLTFNNVFLYLVGNKVDCQDRKVKARQILFPRKHGIQYYDISAKSNYQFEKPFVWLMRKLTGDNALNLVEAPALVPQEVQIDPQQIQNMQNELAAAQNMPVGDDVDEDI